MYPSNDVWIVTKFDSTFRVLKRMYPNAVHVRNSFELPKGCAGTVVGNLPYHVAAELCARGLAYYDIRMEVLQPRPKGTKFTDEDFAMGVVRLSLNRYHVRSLD